MVRGLGTWVTLPGVIRAILPIIAVLLSTCKTTWTFVIRQSHHNLKFISTIPSNPVEDTQCVMMCGSTQVRSSSALLAQSEVEVDPTRPEEFKTISSEGSFEKTLRSEIKHSSGYDISIEKRTIECLDFQVIIETLRNLTVTVLGASIVGQDMAMTAEAATRNYAMVDALTFTLQQFPLSSSMNVWPLLKMIELNSSPPEKEDLAKFAIDIEEIMLLRSFILEQQDKMSLFVPFADAMALPTELSDMFSNAFDDDGQLNADKYPIIKGYRQQLEVLRVKIIHTMQSLLKSDAMRDKIADSGFQEIDGRYCLLLKNTYKKGVGIVHGSSNTGRTLYVEPMEVVEPSNEMKSVNAQLRAEENRIFFEMIKCISRYTDRVAASVRAVAEVDVYRAKAKLGELLRGTIPEVYEEGSIRCVNAKHPVLMLRGVNPVGNKIELSKETTNALVISGPNAGGKTIVLKTAGLFALMARHAIPLPTQSGARVDIMQVMADIGDMQTVSEDLSTFSGHLVVCREMLSKVKQYRGTLTSLVLLDEIGTGTDPAQGAALAQAILEELLELDSMIIVTTHYQRIKELAADDARFQIAAMEFVDNKPTYRLRLGYIGESYALEAGRRMQLPENVLQRANLLLDDESRRVLALQIRLEEQTELARKLQDELKEKIQALSDQEIEIEAEKKRLEEKIQKFKEGKNEEFLVDLRSKERILELLIRQAQEAVQATDAVKSDKVRSVDEAKAAVKAMKVEIEVEMVEAVAADLATPLVPGEPIEEGTTLIVLEKGNLFNCRGIVTQRNKGRGRVLLRIQGVEVKMDRHLLGLPHRPGRLGFATTSNMGIEDESTLSAKDKRMLKMLSEELVDPDKLMGKSLKQQRGDGRLTGPRLGSNTLDIREKNLESSQTMTMTFLQKMAEKSTKDSSVLYIHHGNNKAADAVKPRFRAWLKKIPLVRRMGPAEMADGGDAYTVLELNMSEI